MITPRALLAAAIVAAYFSDGAPGFAASARLTVCEQEMLRASEQHQVPLGVLYAVGLTETGRKGSLQPYALNVEGKALYSTSAAEAIRKFEAARARGAKLIDLGCMQINHYYHGREFRSLSDMLTPQRNVEYAARFLKELRQREGSWTLAVARYHAGPNNNPAQKRYVCQVITNMVATGFGAWTANSRKYCR